MKRRTLLAIAMLSAEITFAAEIPLLTRRLEQRLQPWCPNRCIEEVPFLATYRGGDQILAFVAAHHDFSEHSATNRAVAAGFAQIPPALVIVEGFPTAMGENPAPLVKEARTYGTPETTEYAKGEGMYAASLALKAGVPFLGGEPTRAEELQALKTHGFSTRDIAFAYVVGALSQSLRAGTLKSGADPAITETFRGWVEGFRDQYQLEPLTLEEFSSTYRQTFGVDFRSDTYAVDRAEPGSPSTVGRLKQAEMHVRDEHLWATIQEQLHLKKRLLVVYGGSHWTTLAGVLEEKLGKPTIDSSFK